MALIDVVNQKGEKVDSIELDEKIFNSEIRDNLVQNVVVWQLARRRAGTASTKTRSEVRGGGKKPWRQKGTGRARAGMRNSPVWRGGGTAFGPQPHLYDRGMNKKERRQALCAALTLRWREGKVLIVDRLAVAAIKTQALKALLAKLEVENPLIVVAEPDRKLELSARNLPGVKVLLCAGINVRDVLGHRELVFTRAAVEKLQEALA